MKKLLLILLLPFCVPSSVNAQLYLDLKPCESDFKLFGDGVKIDNPEVSFYGQTANPTRPGVTNDCDIGTGVFGAQWAAGMPIPKDLCFFGQTCVVVAHNRFIFGSACADKELVRSGQTLNLYGIDGSGFGGVIPFNQLSRFKAEQLQNDFNLLFARPFLIGGGFTLYPAIGYSAIFRSLKMKNQLINLDTQFDNGTVHENLISWYNGGKIELALVKKFHANWCAEIIPFIAGYRLHTTLNGTQNFGQNATPSVSLSTGKLQAAYSTGVRFSVQSSFCGFSVGGQIFGEFLSRVPGILNPRDDDDLPARITDKNANLWGGGLFLGRSY